MIANGKKTAAHTSKKTTEPRGISGLRDLTNAVTNTAKMSIKSSRPGSPILFSITSLIDCENEKVTTLDAKNIGIFFGTGSPLSIWYQCTPAAIEPDHFYPCHIRISNWLTNAEHDFL